LTYFKKKKL